MKHNGKSISDAYIAAYLDGGLSGGERDAFEVTLRGSPAVRESIALIEKVGLDQEEHGDAPEGLKRKVVSLYPVHTEILDLILSIAKDAISVLRSSSDMILTQSPQYATVRRQEKRSLTLVKVTRQFENTSVDIHVEHVGDRACNFTVQARDVAANAPLERARVDLLEGQRQLASNPLDNGTALFEDVRPGKYALQFWKNNGVLGTMTIKIIGA